MRRRAFLGALAAGTVAAGGAVQAQQARRIARIGFLSPGTATANARLHQAFVDGLRDHGWVEDRNTVIESRWEGAGPGTLDVLAGDLVRMPLDVLFGVNTPARLAVKRTGTSLPVVFAVASEPVEIGLVESLARPGRNFTGLTTINRELMSKRLEVLKETIPGLVRVGYLANPGYAVHAAQLAEMRAAARGLGLALHLAEVRTASDFPGAFAAMAAARVGAFLVQQDHLFVSHAAQVIDPATERRLPGMYVFSLYPASGGFMSYGASAEDLYRRAAGYVERILKGASPSDLPVERPTKFELVLNVKTARKLGLTVPPAVRLRADRVIE